MEVLSTLVIADVHPKAQSSPEVLSAGEQGLAFSFGKCEVHVEKKELHQTVEWFWSLWRMIMVDLAP